ncbi:MAG TPA: Uma2 family endonuclease [Bryobacteraceae bacterium]|nr:Uma2 family endonuclease [Bryobacteraceae bacterium]
MAVEPQVPVAQYLRTSYRPDCDYVDGEVLERNFGERDHSTTQRNIILCFARRYPRSISRLLPEQRVQVNATRFRIPDICLLGENAPPEQIIRTPPVLCIEILSPEDCWIPFSIASTIISIWGPHAGSSVRKGGADGWVRRAISAKSKSCASKSSRCPSPKCWNSPLSTGAILTGR